MLILALIAVVLIAGIDQLIKFWIVGNFALYEERPFLHIGSLDIMHLHYIQNNGSAFSSFAGKTAFLIVISVIGIGVCTYLLICRTKQRPLLFWCLTAVIGGAAGNLIDRIFRGGAVVDYLDVQLFDFAVFNFADCFITVGTALLAVYILFFSEKDDKRLKSAAPQEEHHDDP
ncbi:MAG: signal peptidase II [Oscillospiraceae bacterium]|nr:signal peptidase II [Oscillospiraceae bacterium]